VQKFQDICPNVWSLESTQRNPQNLLRCTASDAAAARAHWHPSLFAAKAQDIPGVQNRNTTHGSSLGYQDSSSSSV